MNRKAIVALINGAIYIDPSDVKRVDLDVVKVKAKETLGKEIDVVIRPIKEWMPESGTEALMNEAVKKLDKHSSIMDKYYGGYIKNRHQRRKEAKMYRRK